MLTVFLLAGGLAGLSWYLSAPRYNGPVSDHFDGKQFFSPSGQSAKGPTDVLKWLAFRKRSRWKLRAGRQNVPPPVKRSGAPRITFVNHSTFLIQYDGLNILTDPVWSERVSPFSFAGPGRVRPPGIAMNSLPDIDFVLLTHNHYDHLDLPSLKALLARHNYKLIVPLGVRAFLEAKQFEVVTELDWWQEFPLSGDLSVQSVPAQHFSGRGGFDRDATLWCGYVLKGNNGNIYFAGDTGYNASTFVTIGKRCGPFIASILPIGAYIPQWFMSPVHCSPAEAVRIHLDVESPLSIACHYGTFPLADEAQDQPEEDLKKAIRESRITPESFILLPEGQPLELKKR